MKNWKDSVVVGNFAIDPNVLRIFLRKSHYYMSYDPEKEIIFFSVNDGSGGKNIFEIRNASHENAVKLANGLGLNDNHDGKPPEEVLHWSKWNPNLLLYSNGGPEAKELKEEMLRLEIPHRILRSDIYALTYHIGGVSYMLKPPHHSKQEMLNKIREIAEKNSEILASTP
ncbi:MAG: hypothetical protein AAB847_01410 [Patescibacteria group bacterium]